MTRKCFRCEREYTPWFPGQCRCSKCLNMKPGQMPAWALVRYGRAPYDVNDNDMPIRELKQRAPGRRKMERIERRKQSKLRRGE